MKTVTAIEFIRPNARQVPYQVEVSNSAGEKYELLEPLGLRLTVEDLGTGLFNTCIEYTGYDDFIMDLCRPDKVDESFEKMLNKFTVKDFEKFKEDVC